MSDQIAYINVRAVWLRVPLLVLAAVALYGAWYGVRWLIGNTMADAALDFDAAEAAARLAPDDPHAHLTLARLHRITFEPAELPEALRRYEQAASLAPNSYLIWMELGRARGAAGDMEGGAAALRRAVRLAPSYADPRWHLGNLLLRAGRTDEAFAELRLAGDADPVRYRPQVFNMAWQVYNQDMPRVVEAIGSSASARAQLVGVLVGRRRLDDALGLWSSLSDDERREHALVGEVLARSLYEGGRQAAALQTLREAGLSEAAPERISNGGFEGDIAAAGKKFFEWQVLPSAGVQTVVDTRAPRGGRRALRVLFNAPTQIEFNGAGQVFVVAPAARYRLSFYARTEDLKSASTPVVEVLEMSGKPLAASAPLAVGTSDWQQASVEFTPQGEAVLARLTRAGCPGGVCPIFGKVWYDDFDLQRISGRAGAR